MNIKNAIQSFINKFIKEYKKRMEHNIHFPFTPYSCKKLSQEEYKEIEEFIRSFDDLSKSRKG